MSYLIFQTAAGHKIAINSRKQQRVLRSFQEGLIAESRLDCRQIKYQNVRQSRGLSVPKCASLSLAYPLKRELASLDSRTFAQLDSHILAIGNRLRSGHSRPTHFRWLLGDLRLWDSGDAVIVYTLASAKSEPRIQLLSVRIVWRAMERLLNKKSRARSTSAAEIR